jgi:hypothetical protein
MIYAEISFTTTKQRDAILNVFSKIFPNNNLDTAYGNSQLKATFSKESFVFGARNVSVNLLVNIVDREVTVCLENAVKPDDVIELKTQVDNYYDKFKSGFKRQNISLKKSAAYISISGAKVYGDRKTKWEAFVEEISAHWKELLTSLGGVAAIWYFTYVGWLSDEKGKEKMLDWKLTFLPIAGMFLVSLLAVLLPKKSKKKFNFTL